MYCLSENQIEVDILYFYLLNEIILIWRERGQSTLSRTPFYPEQELFLIIFTVACHSPTGI